MKLNTKMITIQLHAYGIMECQYGFVNLVRITFGV